MTRLVLLPALDGTGLMFEPFVAALQDAAPTAAIAYPQSGPQDYDTLAQFVRTQIPAGEDYVLLGESFAGPLVYRIAQADPERCKAAVFVATYLTNPQPKLLKVLSLLPAWLLSFFVRRRVVVRWASLSSAAAREVGAAIAANFARVPPAVFKARLRVIAGENTAPTRPLELPCLYVRAASDRLVLQNKLPDFERLCPALEVRVASGGHFVLQENPADTAKIVAEFVS